MNTFSLILSLAIIAMLIYVLVTILMPFFDPIDRSSSKSYLSTLKEQIDIAEEGGIGEFKLVDLPGGDATFSLIYFGMNIAKDVGGVIYYNPDYGKRILCVGYPSTVGDFGNCEHRLTLNRDVVYGFDCIPRDETCLSRYFSYKNSTWVSGEAYRTKIYILNETYVFSHVGGDFNQGL